MFNPIAHVRPSALTKRIQTVLPLVLFGIFGLLFARQLQHMDMMLIWHAIGQVSLAAWFAAALATACSFRAIGRYDALWHERLQTGATARAAARAGRRAIALSQLLGFSSITGSFLRWRALPALTLWQCTQLSFAVSFSFLACWSVYAAIAIAAMPNALPLGSHPLYVALTALAVIAALFAVLRARGLHILRRPDMARLLGWTGVDMIFAALALYILIPTGADLSFGMLLTAYVVALGAGLISNAPGGAGAFELTLLALLPTTAPEPLIAGIFAFRVIYYIIPALLAFLALIRLAPATGHNTTQLSAAERSVLLARAAPSEWGLARQDAQIINCNGHWLIGKATRCLISIGQTQPSYDSAQALRALQTYARNKSRTVALYKCDAKMASVARQMGWSVRKIAQEAWITPATWKTSGSRKQQLRRKLRHADKAGVVVIDATGALPLKLMQDISTEWATARGAEMQFSMGRYDHAYATGQRVFLIYHDQQLIGFVTFHSGPYDWTLDMIRHRIRIPDGAIHAAIVTAIQAAQTAGIAQLSLAAVPDADMTPAAILRQKSGLLQFKRSFSPTWKPRYIAAPNPAALLWTALAITFAIHRRHLTLPKTLRKPSWRHPHKVVNPTASH